MNFGTGRGIVRVIAGMSFVLLFAANGRGAEAEVAPRDALVYKDGDRIQGKFVERTGEVIIFKSDRFGELHVSAADAVVILADKPAASKSAAVATATTPAVAPKTGTKAENKATTDRADAERVTIWERFSPSVLTAKVRNYFGPWHGRFAFSTELVHDTADRTDIAVEGHMQRKWRADEVQLTSRFDYAETNKVITTDTLKASGSYRHDFSTTQFALYRPSVEWNRASVRNNVPNKYVLLQQEVGAGFNLITKPSRKVRVGVSENFFDVWNSAPQADHSSHAVESFFEETEWTLPWRMTVSQRGVWYYPLSSKPDGWENRVELNKKLTETLSVAIRHEILRHSPDGSAQDYTRLKLLIGLDF